MSNFEKVGKFMRTFGQNVKNKAEFPEEKIINLRYDLIVEELEELKNNTSKSFREFIKSYNSTKHVIHSCFEENGQSGGMIEEIKNDIIKKTKNPLKLFNNKI